MRKVVIAAFVNSVKVKYNGKFAGDAEIFKNPTGSELRSFGPEGFRLSVNLYAPVFYAHSEFLLHEPATRACAYDDGFYLTGYGHLKGTKIDSCFEMQDALFIVKGKIKRTVTSDLVYLIQKGERTWMTRYFTPDTIKDISRCVDEIQYMSTRSIGHED